MAVRIFVVRKYMHFSHSQLVLMGFYKAVKFVHPVFELELKQVVLILESTSRF